MREGEGWIGGVNEEGKYAGRKIRIGFHRLSIVLEDLEVLNEKVDGRKKND